MITTAQEILLEKYHGSKPEFKLIEKEFESIIKYIKERHKSIGGKLNDGDLSTNKKMTSNDLTKLKSVKKIEKLVEKSFGIKECIISFIARDQGLACTFTSTALFLDNGFKTKPNGEKINTQMTINLMFASGLITVYDLNAKELTALLLHEVGHNFYNSIFHTLSFPIGTLIMDLPFNVLSKFPIVGPVFDKLSLSKIVFDVRKWFEETVFSFPGMTRLRDVLDAISDVANATVLLPITSMAKLSLSVIRSMRLGGIFTYAIEKNADSFAVDYGYGTELSSALNKLDIGKNSVRSSVKQVPVVSWVYDMNDILLDHLSSVLSGYPVTSNRIRSNLDRMKKSLNDPDLDPRVKKQLVLQITDMEKFYYDDFLEITSNENKKRPFTFMYRYVVEKLFDGKADIREIIHILDPDKYK